ncbi:MAG: hypothetical protein R3F46_13970 [bacterium]
MARSGPAGRSRRQKTAADLNRDVVFGLLHPTGLVDVKVCSVNETWSALKWVYRKGGSLEWK